MGMIDVRTDEKIEKESTALSLIENSPFSFYLTGSRALGFAKKDSDWDFFVAGSTFSIDWLHKNGFKKIHTQSVPECDYGIECIQPIVCIFGKDNVHVQVVDDVRWKIRAQQFLMNKDFYKTMMERYAIGNPENWERFADFQALPEKAFKRALWDIAFITTQE